MYKTSIWVQRNSVYDKTAYRIVDDDFEEIVVCPAVDWHQWTDESWYRRSIGSSIIDIYIKRKYSAAQIAKCLFIAFKGYQTGSSGNTTIADMIKLTRNLDPRFKDYEEHIKMLLLFS